MNAGNRLFVPWTVLAGCCALIMWAFPGAETLPYHLAWIGIAVAYGLEAWPWGRTLAAVLVYTLVTGTILTVRAVTGVIGFGELAEIPMMSILVLVVVWNVRNRHLAFDSLSRMANRDRHRAAQRQRLSQMTSHEMRTPATIAIGYTEMLLSQETDPERRNDLRVISEELHRLVLAGDRLVRTLRMTDRDDVGMVDIDRVLAETADRWAVIADRDWSVEADAGLQMASAERLRACLDTLMENAVRYTDIGDVVRIFAHVVDDRLLIGVADSGPGMDPLLVRALRLDELGTLKRNSAYTAKDPKAQTGLGLSLVRDAAVARGGRVVAGRSAEGGALVVMCVPCQGAGTHPARTRPLPRQQVPVTAALHV